MDRRRPMEKLTPLYVGVPILRPPLTGRGGRVFVGMVFATRSRAEIRWLEIQMPGLLHGGGGSYCGVISLIVH